MPDTEDTYSIDIKEEGKIIIRLCVTGADAAKAINMVNRLVTMAVARKASTQGLLFVPGESVQKQAPAKLKPVKMEPKAPKPEIQEMKAPEPEPVPEPTPKPIPEPTPEPIPVPEPRPEFIPRPAPVPKGATRVKKWFHEY